MKARLIAAVGLIMLSACSHDDLGTGSTSGRERSTGGSVIYGRFPKVQIAQHDVTLAVGDSTTLFLLLMLPPGYVPHVTWSSSDPNTVSLRQIGSTSAVARGLRIGQAIIHADSAQYRDSTTVVVK